MFNILIRNHNFIDLLDHEARDGYHVVPLSLISKLVQFVYIVDLQSGMNVKHNTLGFLTFSGLEQLVCG